MLSEAQAYNPPENVVSMGETLSPNASYGRIVGKKLRIWPDNFRLARDSTGIGNRRRNARTTRMSGFRLNANGSDGTAAKLGLP